MSAQSQAKHVLVHSKPPILNKRYVVPQRRTKSRELKVNAKITTKNDKKINIKALIDSGCTHTCISNNLVKHERLPTQPIAQPFKALNADGTENKQGMVKEKVKLRMEIQGHREHLEAVVTNIDKTDMFLGHDWLAIHNPTINWKEGSIEFENCPVTCNIMDFPDEQPRV